MEEVSAVPRAPAMWWPGQSVSFGGSFIQNPTILQTSETHLIPPPPYKDHATDVKV